MTDSSDLTADFIESLDQFKGQAHVDSIVESLQVKDDGRMDANTIKKILELVEQMEAMQKEGGTNKWFDPKGPYPIHSLPKHEAFFAAGATYPERLFMAGNRVGKSIAGCYELSCHLTGEYPIWWIG